MIMLVWPVKLRLAGKLGKGPYIVLDHPSKKIFDS